MIERVVVQQEREVVGRRRVEVPDLAIQEARVLRMDAAALVERHVHRGGGALPRVDLVGPQPEVVTRAACACGSLGGEARARPRPRSAG